MLQEIIAAVRTAGDMIRDAHAIERDTREKTGAADLVTKYDVAVQDFLQGALLDICPEADFLGEEGHHAALKRHGAQMLNRAIARSNAVLDRLVKLIKGAHIRQLEHALLVFAVVAQHAIERLERHVTAI